MKYELKRIDLWSVIKIVFMISLVLGFVLTLFYASLLRFVSTFMGTFGGNDFNQIMPSNGIMTGFLILFGTFGIAVIYTFIAAIAIILYNLMAGWGGGVVLFFASLEADPQSQNSHIISE
jgi:hypothetical protein